MLLDLKNMSGLKVYQYKLQQININIPGFQNSIKPVVLKSVFGLISHYDIALQGLYFLLSS